MYSITQIREFIRLHMINARQHAHMRGVAEFNGDTSIAEEYEVKCRAAVYEARAWHRRLLAEYGYASKTAWLNGAKVPPASLDDLEYMIAR